MIPKLRKIATLQEIKELKNIVAQTVVNNPISVKTIISLIKTAGYLSRYGFDPLKVLQSKIEFAERINKKFYRGTL
ncbi:MAG: hypothetical protein PF518_04815 [Spirochaetaceae bacterium]|jgi:hypothetical protein|nr:hypothetical protein [Spirochaetaceae bacterium]